MKAAGPEPWIIAWVVSRPPLKLKAADPRAFAYRLGVKPAALEVVRAAVAGVVAEKDRVT